MSEWKRIFDENRVIPPPQQTSRVAQGPSQAFQLVLKRLDGLHLNQAEEVRSDRYELRVSLFDNSLQRFFGRTWKSEPREATKRNQEQPSKVHFNEVVYFHTSLCLASVVAVVELASLSPGADTSQNAVGQGFGILHLFSGQAQGEGRLSLFHGTPRALLHPTLRDPLQMNAVLSVIEGTQLLYSLQPHPALNPIMHLLPPNIMVSGHELIPGVLPPTDSTADALQRPRLLPAFSCALERVCVCLAPSIQAFEADLLERLNNERNNTRVGAEVRSVVVQERRLHIGVHNGLCWVDGPQVMVLEHMAGGSGGLKQSSTETHSSVLMLQGNVELRMIRHPAFSLLFLLEYAFSVPLARDGKMPSMAVQRAVFMQSVRWGVWSPFSDPDGQYESVCVSLQGGSLPNPYGVMVYTAHTQQTDAEGSVIKFKFTNNLEGATSTVTSKSISQEKPQPKKWHATSHDGSKLGLEASPLCTIRGPGLSVSQLAVASRYPTLSHTTGSPWQQQLPAPLALSPMASAHQLSHVVHPAVGIAHLEVSAMERKGMGDAPEEEYDLHELTFTPVHAPVIMLGTHTTGSSRTSSRGLLAHLFSSRFPEIRDDLNQVAELLDPDEPVNFDPHREEADPLQVNRLLLQFLAFTRVHQAGVDMEWPSMVHFTFQLYRFPPVTTQRLKLVASEASSRPDYPCILSVTNRDGSIGSGPPGLQLQYCVDPAFLKPGERIWFLRYLALHTLHIDVWDSDSLLLIGSAAVQLKHLLRQGRAAVQVIHELEVISTEYLQDASLAREHAGGQRAIPAMSVYTIVKGRLHIRLGNIGGVVQKNPNSSVLLPPSRSHVIQPSQTPTGFQGGSLSANTVLNLNVVARNARRAQRLPDIDGELASLLQSRMRGVDDAWLQSRGETEEVRQRKSDRMAAVRQYEENATSNTHEKASYMRRKEDRTQHSQDLRLIEAYRERCKVEGIINMLSQAITTTHTIYAMLGTAEFFEFVLRNPFNIPQTVTIECEDPELSVIVNAEEWRYFKDLTKMCTPLEVEMFHMKEDSSTPQVYLRPRENVHIPLKYQSFVSGHVMLCQDSKTSNSLHCAHHQQSNTVMAKFIKVFFRAEDSQPLAICQVRVEPTPHIVDQTFRFYQPELSFFKKAIRLPPAEPGTPDACSRLQVRCSDPNVICHVIATAPGEPQDIYLKVPGAPSPQIKTFVITVFNDPWLASPTQTWQVYMHYLQKLDISCVCGTLSWHSLVLRGTQSIRKVKCYTSHPLELQVDPEEVFALPALGVQDIRLGVKALHSGSCFRYLNVVDVDTRQLVASWLLCLTFRQPVISRAFEIQVPVGGGRGSNKKIGFTNPYPSNRGFRLCSDHPDLLQFKEEKFQIDGGASYNIGLRFAPSQSAGTEEILVFINDLEDKNEETYCIKVVYR
ncbi:nephrocystin-4 isoform X1 [Ictalurus furcatus]|uniref:nephrocystin-4 isoform X1 n=1 Tax=Ictalurus furcatus TaxID=66913 RepID=UPI0023502895|nr:nephrocystin-4 isoform X1 [Ictalurus furcatus]